MRYLLRWIPPALHVVLLTYLYGYFTLSALMDSTERVDGPFVLRILVLLIAISFGLNVTSVMATSRDLKNGYDRFYLKAALFIKFTSIPFFAMNLLIYTGAVAAFFTPEGGILVWLTQPYLLIISYIALLTGSIYSITAAIWAARYRAISTPQAGLITLLQLVFITDIFGTLFLSRLLKRRK